MQYVLLYCIVAPDVIANPIGEIALPGQVKTFSCVFIGHTLPAWIITMPEGDPVTVPHGMKTAMFNYPAISAINEAGTVSTLEVTADLSLNQSTYKCHISALTPVESTSATLTVFGRFCNCYTV